MTDRAVPNLPSRDLAVTSAFYGGFGFVQLHRDDSWLVQRRGVLQLEFFRTTTSTPLGMIRVLSARGRPAGPVRRSAGSNLLRMIADGDAR